MVIRGPYDDIDFSPPKGCIAEAKKGIEWHEEGLSGDGLVPATVRWARRLARGENITPAKAKKMRAWLARHEVDKEGEGFRPGEKGYPSPGRVAWALWCGDPGVAWSNKLVKQMNAADESKGLSVEITPEEVADGIVRKLYAPIKAYGEMDDEDEEMSGGDLTYVVASAPTPDRYNDIVQPDWRLERFMSNPVVPFAHDYTQPPVGKVVSLEVLNGTLIAAIEWDDSPENPLGQTVASQFRRGFMNAVSVGFAPGEVVARSTLPPEDPYYGESGNVYRSPELLEISAVPIPAHAGALAIRALSDIETKHIVAIEENDDTFVVTYAKRMDEASAVDEEDSQDEPDESKAMLNVFGKHPLTSIFGQ